MDRYYDIRAGTKSLGPANGTYRTHTNENNYEANGRESGLKDADISLRRRYED
jgi:hypothetical protein